MHPKVALCAIVRSEENYLQEWIEYHLALGFEHLFIYDNNDPENDAVRLLCQGKSWERRISIINYRGYQGVQLLAYNDCYMRNGKEFDWFAFLDADEFLTLGPETQAKTIGEYLAEAADCDEILVNWLYYGDNGKARQEPGSLIERFPEGLPQSAENRHVKTIARSGLPLQFVRNPHVMEGLARIADDCFRPVPYEEPMSPFKTPSYRRLYIRHYGTKTIEEYIRYKIRRGAADQHTNPYRLELFYRVNERSREKRAVEKEYFRVVHRQEGKPAPTVSVIVPNYNHSKYVRQRIDSVLAQTFTDFELILLDDCSTDNSPNVLLEYRDHPAVSYILLNTRNSGSPFMQWEKGIRLARGRYIWIAESDDMTDPEFLQATVEQLEKHPEARLCATGSHVINSEGKIISWPEPFDHWEEDGTAHLYGSYDYLLNHMLKYNSVYNASMVLFRKEGCLEGICSEYRHMHYCGDWLFWVEQVRKGSVIEIRRKLNYFRKHTSNTTYLGAEDGRSLPEIAFIKNWLCRQVIHKWKYSLQNKGDFYRTVRKWPVSSSKRRKELLREVAQKGNVTWWHYQIWKLYNSFYKHILHRPID